MPRAWRGWRTVRSAGPPRRLSAAEKALLAARVEAGPDPKVDRVVRWRRIDLKRWIEAEFGVVMHERTVGKQLGALGYRRLSVLAQTRVSVPCWPTRASSWNQTSRGLPRAASGTAAATASRKFF